MSDTLYRTQTGEFPARGEDVVQILINDHQHIKRYLDELSRSEGASRINALEQLKAILTVHNATEENLVYPALAAIANEKIEPRKLYFETAEADMLLFQLDEMTKGALDGDFAKKCEKFVAAVREHIDDEEGSAFPHLLKKTEAADQERLTSAVREYRTKLRFAGTV